MSADEVETRLDGRSARMAAIALEQELMIAVQACTDLLDIVRDGASALEPFDSRAASELRRRAWTAAANLRGAGHALHDIPLNSGE